MLLIIGYNHDPVQSRHRKGVQFLTLESIDAQLVTALYLELTELCVSSEFKFKGAMAEYSSSAGGGVGDVDYGESSELGGRGGLSSDEEYETMTAAEVLEKLEEVGQH